MKQSFQLTCINQRRLGKILPFGIIGLLFGCVYAFIERGLLGTLSYYPASGNPYESIENSLSTIIQSGVIGLILGAIEILIFSKLFSKKSFVTKFIFKSLVYILMILVCEALFSMISTSIVHEVSLFDPVVIMRLIGFFSSAGFWSIMLFIGLVFSVAIFISELSDHIGQNVIINLLLGKYHRPREEERIFMFMDLKSSTPLAEKLGHVQYFKFLNEYYADITEAIIETQGEIHQYVGDEVIVSWTMKGGLPNNNCLRCFFMSQELIRNNTQKYLNAFKMVPEFKAGLHYGRVTTGRIGVVKKEIIFTGDVLNTTERIQSICNEFGVDNLVSDELLTKLTLTSEYESTVIGECHLHGKDTLVNLYTIKKCQVSENLQAIKEGLVHTELQIGRAS